MTDKELKAKILAEIEKKIKVLSPFIHQGSDTCGKVVRQLESLVSFINSLSEEPVSEELEEAAWLYYDKNRLPIPPEWDFHKEFIDFFKAGANWKGNHLWKSADGDDLPKYDREVVVFTQNFPDDAGMMRVAIGHRPNPDGWDGKSIATGEIKHYTPKTYDKGGWNIPNVKYWLDCSMPKEIEL